MLLGCAYVSKTDASQSLEPATRRSVAAGVGDAVNLYHDLALRNDRPGSRQLPARLDGRATSSATDPRPRRQRDGRRSTRSPSRPSCSSAGGGRSRNRRHRNTRASIRRLTRLGVAAQQRCQIAEEQHVGQPVRGDVRVRRIPPLPASSRAPSLPPRAGSLSTISAGEAQPGGMATTSVCGCWRPPWAAGPTPTACG